jgi:hypothetical protein
MVAVAISVCVFALSFYRFQQRQMMNEVASKLGSVERLFMGILDTDANIMGAATHFIIRDEQMKVGLKTKDKKALLDLSLDLFGQLHTEHQITHFYFTGPDRVNILRVHKPDKHGDRINRFTTLQAEKTGELSYGIELGPLGTLTLRVVQPWYDGRKLIGYVELGEEIHHITRKLHHVLGVEIYVVIEKERLDRRNWETGMRMLNREGDWDRFSSVVMVDQTLSAFPESLARFLPEEHHTSVKTDVGVSLNNRRYRARFIHLKDASGSSIGDMVVMVDVTDLTSDFHDAVVLMGAICLAVSGIMCLVFYAVVSRAERRIGKMPEGALGPKDV